TIAQKLLYHRVQEPAPVRDIRPDVPLGVARVIERMLAKNPADRFQQPFDVVTALEPWTRASIPPPPESEMPHLSRAARRAEPPTTPIPRSSRPPLHSSGNSRPPAAPIHPECRSGPAILKVGRAIIARCAKWIRRGRPASLPPG